jgi:hypothetical protein
VPLGRPWAFGLKSAAQTERAGLDLPPAASTEELALGGHGRARHAEVNTDHLSRGLDWRLRGFDHDMQPKPTLAVYAEVGRTHRQIHTPRMAKGDAQRYPLPTGGRRTSTLRRYLGHRTTWDLPESTTRWSHCGVVRMFACYGV